MANPSSSQRAQPADRGRSSPSLAQGTLTVPELVANNIAEVAPAIATIFVFAAIVAAAGVGSPFVILIAAIGFACHVNSTAQFSRVCPSAGFYATYCARAFGPRTGATIAGGYLLAMFVFYTAVFFQIGVWVSTIVQRSFGFGLPWWIAALVLEGVVVALLLRGVKILVLTAVSLFAVEAAGLFICAIAMLVTSWGQISGAGFNPANIKNGPSGFGLGFVLAIFLFLGASGSSPLAEEARRPRRAPPSSSTCSWPGRWWWACTAAPPGSPRPAFRSYRQRSRLRHRFSTCSTSPASPAPWACCSERATQAHVCCTTSLATGCCRSS